MSNLAQQFNSDKSVIYDYFRKLGIIKKSENRLKKLSALNISTVLELYQAGQSIYSIGDLLNVSPTTIYHHIKANNLESKSVGPYRTYTVNEAFFEEID